MMMSDHGSGYGIIGVGGSGDVEVKTQFMTREGLYKLHTVSDFPRPTRLGSGPYSATSSIHPNATTIGGPGTMGGAPGTTGVNSGGASSSNNPAVRVSFALNHNQQSTDPNNLDSKLVFNCGREIFVYPFKGIRKSADLAKPIDKRIYKGTCPTCHDFGTPANIGLTPGSNPETNSPETSTSSKSSGGESNSTQGSSRAASSEMSPLLIGFTQGQIQLVDPVKKELSKLYNEERLIEKTKVTCIKWIPGSSNLFLASYASGCLYVFNQELVCAPTAPVYQMFKQGDGFSVYTCKTKSTRNPLYKWSIGQGAVNQFAFSPCGRLLSTVSQDGYLRIFNYHEMELLGLARSYFGGFSCVCWSPDSRYVACGGEDDLITVYSVGENRVVVRGQGHKSWVSQVAFDEYNMSYGDVPDGLDFSGSDEDDSPEAPMFYMNGRSGSFNAKRLPGDRSSNSLSSSSSLPPVSCYRLGSIGEDAHLCFWDLTEDVLRKASVLQSVSQAGNASSLDPKLNHLGEPSLASSNKTISTSTASDLNNSSAASSASTTISATKEQGSHRGSSLTSRLASLTLMDKGKSKSQSKGSSSGSGTNKSDVNQSNGANVNSKSTQSSAGTGPSTSSSSFKSQDHVKLGSDQCPRINQVPLIEPLICKRISRERLTSLTFLEECLVIACQDGDISTWARPGRLSGSFPSGATFVCPGSPPHANSSSIGPGSSGTVV